MGGGGEIRDGEASRSSEGRAGMYWNGRTPEEKGGYPPWTPIPPPRPPPPFLPFQYLRLTAKILLRRLRCQADLSLKIFGPPSAGTISAPKGHAADELSITCALKPAPTPSPASLPLDPTWCRPACGPRALLKKPEFCC